MATKKRTTKRRATKKTAAPKRARRSTGKHGKTAAEKKHYAAYRAAKRKLIREFFG